VEQPLSASFGVAVYPRDAQDGPDLLRAADRALYTAKRTGRNRVVVAERDGAPHRVGVATPAPGTRPTRWRPAGR
jgi:predicted signal transduction protein with EAL and GGDEF domain